MRFIKIKDVVAKTGMPKASIYFAIAKGQFPVQLKVSSRSVVWNESEIEEWMLNCIAQRNTQLAR